MKSQLYESYASVLRKMKALEEEKSTLQASILDDMGANGLQQLKTDDATFSITSTVKYAYTKTVDDIEKTLKERKELEKKEGIATKEENPALRVQLK